ncbi:PKD domain-containing protein [Streptomyces sp. NBC_01351]|uniref:PKD domain-containing protein n=1 Tax=Streptomyces sp. NBC_01351 TaxID=2903833 RepID=UPI002E3353F9|nr:PKD domain-containing protein [Streptomyces sp. NBC_01351]
MRPTRTTVLLTAGLVTLLGVPAGAAAAAETPHFLYVSNLDGSNCSDAGVGTQAVPYCTISAAAKVVQPGQTVQIKPGKPYDESVTIDRSGEPGKPIALVTEGIDEAGLPAQMSLGNGALTVTGASHVVLRGLVTTGPVRVGGSKDVELDRINARNDDIVVGGASTDVRLTRSDVYGVRIEGGARGTLLGRNYFRGHTETALTVVDAPGTVVTNNTFPIYCVTAVSLSGASTGSAVFNNVIHPLQFTPCPAGSALSGIVVSESAAAGTRADSNLLVDGATSQLNAYNWAGTAYETAAAFQAATGQGAHDIVTPSAPGTLNGGDKSLAVDAGDPTAPGVLPTDNRGFGTADDPRVPNTGKGGGFIDRGARETQDDLRVSLQLEPVFAPAGTSVTAKPIVSSTWSSSPTFHYDFGDGTAPVVTKEYGAAHVYTSPGEYVVKVTAVNDFGRKASTEQKTKVTPAGPLTADFTATSVLPTSDSPTSRIAPLTVSVDTTSSATPWPLESTIVDFGDGSAGYRSLGSVQHAYARPGEYKVTVSLKDIKGAESKVTKTVKVDYAASGYVATAPFRLMDSRSHGYSPLRGGVPAAVHLPVGLSLHDHPMSGGMASVVLNVTVTNATQDAFLAVSPYAQERPTTSNLNVPAGGTVSNTVTVPVSALGKAWFTLNAGQADVIVDFVGYYQPNIGQKFSPINPARLADTRTEGGAVAGGQTRTVKVAGVAGIPADAKAVAVNLTSTDATSNSYVVAYPDPAKRPDVSNLNPEPGKAKSNQAIVPVGTDGTITLYNQWGSTHLIVDAVGYYGQDGKALFTPVVPQRLGDTRVTGKLGAGATTTVGGVPAGALGAVVNLTATESTGAGYLTAYGFGATRPDASSLNTLPGLTIPNHVTTPVGNGKISVFNGPWGGSTHVITDLLGYFTQG